MARLKPRPFKASLLVSSKLRYLFHSALVEAWRDRSFGCCLMERFYSAVAAVCYAEGNS
jgi:hypothetical protein